MLSKGRARAVPRTGFNGEGRPAEQHSGRPHDATPQRLGDRVVAAARLPRPCLSTRSPRARTRSGKSGTDCSCWADNR
jgi:hypothetical protein